MKSLQFRRGREEGWRELDALVQRVEKEGVAALSAGDLSRLPVLYRACVSSLSVARAVSLDASLLSYLESLTVRAYLCVYGAKRGAGDTVRDFLRHRFPEALRTFRLHIFAAALILALGTLTGLALTRADHDRYYSLVPAELAEGRHPSASTEELHSQLHVEKPAADRLGAFAMFLFTHNAQVGILAFSLGFAAGIPVALLLFYNGLMLGAMAALYTDRGLGPEFWAWVLPHGITELMAVAVCGGGGLVLAESLLFPGRHDRLHSLAERGRQAGVLVAGAFVMFLLAGLIEGIFRQSVHHVGARAAVALATAIAWTAYFIATGRRRPGIR
jgi:uncharacterized membrane protein SpoIIM required for sporulation